MIFKVIEAIEVVQKDLDALKTALAAQRQSRVIVAAILNGNADPVVAKVRSVVSQSVEKHKEKTDNAK